MSPTVLPSQDVLRTLKKRPVRSTRDMANLSAYNSDFLSGLFADVAKVNVLSQFEIVEKKRGAACVESSSEDDDESLPTIPTKKTRLSLNRCLSRARASQMNLSELADSLPSPRAVHEFPYVPAGTPSRGSTPSRAAVATPTTTSSMSKQDSLAFQLCCVSDSSTCVGDAARFAFPKLPTAISDASCGPGLTRARLVRQATSPENETKESFGWFVDLDDNKTPLAITSASAGIASIVSSDNLAFQAQTAPKGEQDNAELEWAKAADTVDDVLGDFF